MSKDFQFVSDKLLEFHQNVQKLDKGVKNNGDSGTINQNKETCKILSEQLIHKFKAGKYQPNENMKIQKLSKDFEKIIQQYQSLIEQIRENKIQQAIEFERRYSQASDRRQTQIQEAHKKKEAINLTTDQDDESDLREMETINPEVEHYQMLIKEKNSEILDIQNEVLEVYKIMEDVAKITNDQGLELDIAETNINTSNKNVKDTVIELSDAKKHHGAYMKKMCIIAGIGTVVILAVVLPIVL